MKRSVLKICPATNGLPTRMGKETWDKVCASRRKKKKTNIMMPEAEILNFCHVCEGKLVPTELTLVDTW